MDGTATDIEMATLLTALRMKGETITEITACAEVMREKGAHIEPRGAVMDIVGTGGDEVGSFNTVSYTHLEAVLPAGTLSGAPKIRACEIIEELERAPRGVYGGALGYLDLAGNMDTCIAIRMAAKKEGMVTVQAGGGIVADSVQMCIRDRYISEFEK